MTGRTGFVLFWISSGLATLALVLVVVNAALTLGNRAVQQDVNQRQQQINANLQQTRQLEALARSIAASAYNTRDEKLRTLLAQHGITYTVTTNLPPSSAGAAAPAAPAATPAPAPQ